MDGVFFGEPSTNALLVMNTQCMRRLKVQSVQRANIRRIGCVIKSIYRKSELGMCATNELCKNDVWERCWVFDRRECLSLRRFFFVGTMYFYLMPRVKNVSEEIY